MATVQEKKRGIMRQAIDYTEYRASVDRFNAGECEACSDNFDNEGGLCLFHEGVEAGLRLARYVMNGALDNAGETEVNPDVIAQILEGRLAQHG